MSEWISVKERLPEEHESLIGKLYGTDKWDPSMWRRTSGELLVVLRFDDGSEKVTTCKTHDGEWYLSGIHRATITHWMPLPPPPGEEERHETVCRL